MHHWLMKTEPGEFAFEDLEREGQTCWDGVRNHLAQRHLRAMAVGDAVLIYHSVGPKCVVGVARVSRTAYPDPTAEPGAPWMAVEVQPAYRLPTPVTLAVIKQTPELSDIPLIRQSRLSVMPLTAQAFGQLLALGGVPATP